MNNINENNKSIEVNQSRNQCLSAGRCCSFECKTICSVWVVLPDDGLYTGQD